jgi:carboxymethylenebutenolidase
VLVIHENRGLTAHITHVARRWAASGWSALALDLLSEEGGTGSFPDEAAVSARLSQISADPNSTRFVDDMKAAVTELGRRVGRRSPLGATGFCFGGGMIWNLLASREPRLSAAAPFYGPFPTGGNLKGNRANVLGVYAGNDDRVNATRAAARAALDAARLDYELLTFAEQAQPPTNPPTYLVGHAFFNDTGARFNPAAAEEAWRRVVSWFNDADKGHDHHHHHH